jgi:hypothetical protein
MRTAGEKYDPAMRITEQSQADAYFEKLVRLNMAETGTSRAQAESVERENLGYWAGYGKLETRARVEKLFGAFHPVLPPASEGELTAQELFKRGFEWARTSKRMPPWPRRGEPFE